ncbi:MAG TPA: DUF4080 domain-containing protein [Patescibacteria group bacterium]|nr:DUF4080 domain-containing protein [Patescibacteria group bacterium]
MKVVLSTLNAKYIHSSLALYSLAKAGEKESRKLAVREYSINNSLLEILSDLFGEQPAVLGLACYIWNIEMILPLTAMIKKVLPDTVIVLGGPEVSADPAAALQRQPGVDCVVLGEGEDIWRNLLDVLEAGADIAAVKGLAVRRGQEILITGEPGRIQRLDSLEFPYSDEVMSALKDKIIYYESSRGCPFSCRYCLSGAAGTVRCRSLEPVCREMQFFIRHQVKQVKFVDRTFNAVKSHYFPLMRFLAKQDCDTNFHFEMAADLLDDEVVEFLAAAPAGRFQFEIGIQSTALDTLQAIQRHNHWERIVRNVDKIRAYDTIHLHLDLIVGLPRETWADFERSFNDVYWLRPHMLQIGFLKLLKGSGIRQDAPEYQYAFMSEAPYEVLASDAMTYGEIRRLKQLEEVFNQVYNSGHLTQTLRYLVSLWGNNPFRLFLDLTEYWERQRLFLAAHNAKKICRHLLDYIAASRPEAVALLQELMKFDALLDPRGGGRLEFLPWNERFGGNEREEGLKNGIQDPWLEEKNLFWRNPDIVKKYIPDFVFSSWRDLRKKYHIEVFPWNIPQWAKSSSAAPEEKATAALFEQSAGTVRVHLLATADFAPGKKEQL